mmetsp:Transcript_40413/g.86072  ORF Transcript_40413/g.86072 Transcript_40413/m.86072 type:complete len:236 (+) Transcript_40413:1214-1921(+)
MLRKNAPHHGHRGDCSQSALQVRRQSRLHLYLFREWLQKICTLHASMLQSKQGVSIWLLREFTALLPLIAALGFEELSPLLLCSGHAVLRSPLEHASFTNAAPACEEDIEVLHALVNELHVIEIVLSKLALFDIDLDHHHVVSLTFQHGNLVLTLHAIALVHRSWPSTTFILRSRQRSFSIGLEIDSLGRPSEDRALRPAEARWVRERLCACLLQHRRHAPRVLAERQRHRHLPR